MLIELSITPLGRGTHLSKDLANILKIIDESDVRYCLTPFGTCLEGGWDEVMDRQEVSRPSAFCFESCPHNNSDRGRRRS